MPSKPKKNRHTGSHLLGAELKRLRGGRSLADIAELSRTPPLSHHVAPIAAPTLCQLETGTSMPEMATLYTLSHVYKVSMNQLLGYVVEERIAKEIEPLDFATEEALHAEFSKRLLAGEWHRALALALRGEHMARTHARRVTWRANRATCLSQTGMHSEAIALLVDCGELQDVPHAQQVHFQLHLAMTHLNSGNLRAAAAVIREAASMADGEEVPSALRREVSLQRAAITVQAERGDTALSQRRLRELLRETEQDLLDVAGDERTHLQLVFVQAEATRRLGNDLLAEKYFRQLVERARAAGITLAEVWGLMGLGHLALGASKANVAESWLGQALEKAESHRHLKDAFDCSFLLFKLLRPEHPTRAVRHLRRCKELFPLLASRGPLVAEFERFEQELA